MKGEMLQDNSQSCCGSECCNTPSKEKSSEDLKQLVRDKYGKIAESGCGDSNSCCGVIETSSTDYTIFADDYSKLSGYNPAADLKLGCGIPTDFAKISRGDVVVDLGSGAGNDAFVAQSFVGETGRVIGIDMTEQMIEKARQNAERLRCTNVEFRLGEIENIPLEEDTADVVVSNCVLNLVPNKEKAFSEMFRILRPGGHFSISDIVLSKSLPNELREAAEMYAGCVAGASLKTDYMKIIEEVGFENITIQKEKPITLPNEVLTKYLSDKEIASLTQKGPIILSLTVYGEKPRFGSQEH